MGEELISESFISKKEVLKLLERLDQDKYEIKNLEIVCVLKDITTEEKLQKLFDMIKLNSGRLDVRSENGKMSGEGEVGKKFDKIIDGLNFIDEMREVGDFQEIRSEFKMKGNTQVSIFKHGEGEDDHTLYVISNKEDVIDELRALIGEKKKVERESREKEEGSYCQYCGAWKGKKDVCPECGRS
ncbi:MAG: hypothetical protein B5M53_00700 [Candidatus Cloacimonas sp. 4484_209]|nr:MAG: hypothetical protein B5M53_00700 [Candidatus Cloacimonas sp. 4484_209]